MKVRSVAGLIGGSLLVLSSAAHASLGWPTLEASLTQAGVDRELIEGLTSGGSLAASRSY